MYGKNVNNEWVEIQQLMASDIASNNLFGKSVAIYEGTIVVRAKGRVSL